MFVFDTTGSMEDALTEAREEIQEAMTQIGVALPDSQFGLAEMRDYGGAPWDTERPIDVPWTLNVPITANTGAVSAGLNTLFAAGGGDGPEAYGRALYETDVNPAVGWRPGARGVILLVADNVPHDTDLNQGIPPDLWAEESPFDTGIDPGRDSIVGNGDDLDWQNSVLQSLVNDGRPLEYVDYFGDSELFPYWQNWTGRTGGSALQANGESLAGQIVALVKAGATAPLPPCPSGLVRDSNNRCSVPLPPPPPSNNFKIEPRISCAKGCYVVNVKIVFDSAGNVIAESVLEEEPAKTSTAGASAVVSAKKGSCAKGKGAKASKAAKCKKPALINKLSQPVVAGPNTLSLKLTGAAKKALNKKGKLALKVKFTFTPTGGTAKTATQTFTVKKPVKKPAKKPAKKG
jgi:hypothetical protein